MSVISRQSATLLGPGKGRSLYFSLLAGNCGPWLAAGLIKGQSKAAAQNSDAATTLADFAGHNKQRLHLEALVVRTEAVDKFANCFREGFTSTREKDRDTFNVLIETRPDLGQNCNSSVTWAAGFISLK